jgi:hypothetical protein
MNVNKSSLFWGMLLIIGGALALAQQLGYVNELSPQVGMYSFIAVSLVALVMYALSRWKEWGWLFPAGIFGGLAVTTALAINNTNSAAVGSPLFFGLLIPFAAAYLTDRSRNWWALIPGGVMLFLALVTLLVDSTAGDEWIGSLFLFMVAISFLAVYLNDQTRTWALIVAYVTGVLGIAPLMAMGGGDAEYFGPIFLFAVALPFFVVYFRSAENWWAIIPAGAVSVVAVIATLAIAGVINDSSSGGYVGAFLMAGLSATFAVLWLRHAKDWAKTVTIVLGALAVASAFFSSFYEMFWPVAFILGGIYLLYIAIRRPKTV